MPGPLSATAMVTVAPSSPMVTTVLVPGGGVGADVAEEVIDHLTEAGLVAVDLDGAGGYEGDWPPLIDGPRRAHGLGREADDLYGLQCEGASLVQAGEEEELFDELAHAACFGAYAGHDSFEVAGPTAGAPLEELGVRGDGGDGCSQLVGGVSDEAAESGFGRRATPFRWHRAHRTRHGCVRAWR